MAKIELLKGRIVLADSSNRMGSGIDDGNLLEDGNPAMVGE